MESFNLTGNARDARVYHNSSSHSVMSVGMGKVDTQLSSSAAAWRRLRASHLLSLLAGGVVATGLLIPSSVAIANPPVRPAELPYMKCRMWETPPNWVGFQNPNWQTWTYDPNFPPMVVFNKEAIAAPDLAASWVARIVNRYRGIILSNPATAGYLSQFDSDIAISPLNFGGNWDQNASNPTRFIRTDEPLLYAPVQNSSHPFYQQHFWQTTGFEAARHWMNASGTGFLDQLAVRVGNTQLDPCERMPSIPVRFICDTELPYLPPTGDLAPRYLAALDGRNETLRLIAMLGDARAASNLPQYKIPYRSSAGYNLSEWFARASAEFTTSPFPITSGETWSGPFAGLNTAFTFGLNTDRNQQFGYFAERLWQMQIDGAIAYGICEPIDARPAFAATKVSNYAFTQVDDDFQTDASISTAGTRLVRSNTTRVRGGTPYTSGWHFEKVNNNGNITDRTATRVGYIGDKEIRDEGAYSVGKWISSGFRRTQNVSRTGLDLSAPGMYVVHPGHQEPSLYRPPTTFPIQRYQIGIGGTSVPMTAPMETYEEAMIRVFRHNLESTFYSEHVGRDTTKVTPWLSLPFIDHDLVRNSTGTITDVGPMPPVSEEMLRQTFLLCYQFGLVEANVFGQLTGFCPDGFPAGCGTNGAASGGTGSVVAPGTCQSGDPVHWQRLQEIYYEVMNPWVESAVVYRGTSTTGLGSSANVANLRSVVQSSTGSPVNFGVRSQYLGSNAAQTGLEITVAGLPPKQVMNEFPIVTKNLRVTLETGASDTDQSLNGALYVYQRTTLPGWQTPSEQWSWVELPIVDFHHLTATTDARRNRYGCWSRDGSIRRTFDFQLRDDSVTDGAGRIRFRWVEFAWDDANNTPLGTEFTTRFDYFHAMFTSPPNTPTPGGEENMLMGGDGFAGEVTLADQNLDGSVDSLDVGQFFADFAADSIAADVNMDNVTSSQDVTEFFDHYSTP